MPHSNGIRVIAWIVLAIINGDVARGQAGPNVIALLNGQAVLDCPVSSMASTQWTRTTDGNSNTLLIASSCSVSGNNAAYYSTEQLGGNICRLTIGNATMEMGGVYTCFDGSSTSYRSLVTAIDPVASVVYNQAEVVEGDQLDISCSINYTGPSSPAPSLRPKPYFISQGQSFTSEIYHPSINVVTVVATVRVQKPTVPIFQCNTVFEITEGSTTGYNMTAPADNLTVGFTTIEISVLSPVSPNLWYLFLLLLLLIPIFILGYLWYQKKLPCRTKGKSKDSDFLHHQEITDIMHISKTTDLSTTPKEITDIMNISKTTDPSTTPKENIEITHISKTTDPSTTPKENIELMNISKTTDPSTTPKDIEIVSISKTTDQSTTPQENIEITHISKTTDPSTTPKENIELMHISKTTDPSTTPKENIELMHISKTTDPSTTPKEDP